MWPTYNLFHPDMARAMLAYRERRRTQAALHATANNYSGYMFPWEVRVLPERTGSM